MGIILGRFKKKASTYEALEKLDTEIKSIEEFRRSTEQTHKKIVGRFVLISIFCYILTAFVIYFYFFPASVYERTLYVVPLILAPVVILSIKRILTWYYNRKLRKNQKKLIDLKDEKKKLLEDVMNKETYKVATTILEKFAPEEIKKNAPSQSTPLKSTNLLVPSSTNQKALRYRNVNPQNIPERSISRVATPQLSLMPPSAINSPIGSQVVPSRPIPGTPLLLPRAILPRERTVFDKMVDYLVGDGPSNRYALICKHCSSHNGMALKEEFEYLSFRCCYCLMFNPAQKQRPIAPKLKQGQSSIKEKSTDTSDSEKNSQSDTESEMNMDESKIFDVEKLSDVETEKLSDLEVMNGSSGNESSPSPMDVDDVLISNNKNDLENVNKIETEDPEVDSNKINQKD